MMKFKKGFTPTLSVSKVSGFTLIELLVVVAIIGVLSAVVLSSVNSARAKARDERRNSDIKQIRTAIEFYFSVNGFYPTSGGAIAPNPGWSNSSDNSWQTLATQLQPYISSLPKDPQQSTDTAIWAENGYAYSYYSCTSGPYFHTSYILVYHLEKAKGPDQGGYICETLHKRGGSGANTIIKSVGSKS